MADPCRRLYAGSPTSGSSGRWAAGCSPGAGTSPSVLPPINATTTYNAQLPIRIGDYIGIDCCASAAVGAKFFVTGAAIRNEWQRPSLADGGPARPPSSTTPLRGRAQRRHHLDLHRRRDHAQQEERNGDAHRHRRAPRRADRGGQGRQGRQRRHQQQTVTAPGSVQLLIKAKGKKKKKLNSTGKVKVKPKITYTPTGGETVTKPVKVKLIKR